MKMHTRLFADTNMILSPSCVHEHGVAIRIQYKHKLSRQMNDYQDKAVEGFRVYLVSMQAKFMGTQQIPAPSVSSCCQTLIRLACTV